MTQREKNRINEHKSHDFEVSNQKSVNQPDQKLIKCDCGWCGWLSSEAIKELDRVHEIWLSGN